MYSVMPTTTWRSGIIQISNPATGVNELGATSIKKKKNYKNKKYFTGLKVTQIKITLKFYHKQ